MIPLRRALIAVLLGCAQAPLPPEPVAPHYLAALTADGLEERTQACLRIDDPSLQGDCLLHAAGGAARSGEDASATCGVITDSRWQQACYFEISDAAGLIDQAAIDACSRAPEFQDRCLSHAIVRHAGRVAGRFGLGDEDAFIDWIVEQSERYGLDSAERVVADVLAQHISSRACPDRGGESPCPDFSFTDCGAAPAEICRQAYRVTARTGARHVDIHTVCSQPIEREALRSAGLPVWESGFARTAIETWGHICQSMTGQTPPPGGPICRARVSRCP